MKGKLERLEQGELQKRLAKKCEEYQEVEAERKFVLQQTGRHLPGTARERYALDLKEIRDEIRIIRALLQAKKPD